MRDAEEAWAEADRAFRACLGEKRGLGPRKTEAGMANLQPVAPPQEAFWDEAVIERLVQREFVERWDRHLQDLNSTPWLDPVRQLEDEERRLADIQARLLAHRPDAAWTSTAQAMIVNAGGSTTHLDVHRDALALRWGQAEREIALRRIAFFRALPHREFDPRFASETLAKASRPTLTLKQLAAKFMEDPTRERKEKTLQAYRGKLKVILSLLGEHRAVAEVSQEDCLALLADLRRLPANALKRYPGATLRQAIERGAVDGADMVESKTVKDHYVVLNALFTWAERNGLVEKNPARGLTPKGKAPLPRLPFSVAQLQLLFGSPLYCGQQRSGVMSYEPHRFWAPLIALFSGMRQEEIALLATADIVKERGVYAFSLVSRDLKTASSRRTVPVHPKLQEVGFLDYAQSLPAGPLFPDLMQAKDPADALSKWFGRYRRAVGVQGRQFVFHSFRHSFRDACIEGDVERTLSDALGGWKDRAVSARYGKGASIQKLAEAIAKVSYPGLDLSHLTRR